ncbi:MAG: hypothetical protein MUF00_19795 [Gemmatimonadaceae bacterium]|jgi:hypothetical protein|nr:hypothetical protein [Gemmatimonadaceae bacterium]
MTQLLQSAFAAAAKLPAEEQDALGRALLAELHSEGTIDALIESRPDALASLAARARAEFSGGRTESLDPERI